MEQNLELCKEWFEEIAEKASRLTTGNVSHLGTTIRGLALNCAEYIKNAKQEPVDLEKEIDKFWNPRFNLGWDEKSLLSINHDGFKSIAYHFYELGRTDL